MTLSMKELMLETGESKSTIHYYLKEGLLPEPEKPKPNVHKYERTSINIIKFIKKLQIDFGYSIAEIKNVFKYNNFDFDGSFDNLVSSLEIMSGSKDNIWYSKEELLNITGISEQTLIRYKRKEYILERTKGYSTKEIQMINILRKAEENNVDLKLINRYVKEAKKLAELEYEIGAKQLEEADNHNEQYDILFNIILSLKPYIFNIQTVKKHQEIIGEK